MQYSKFFESFKDKSIIDEESLNSLIKQSINQSDRQTKIVDIATKLFKASKLTSQDEISTTIKKISDDSLEFIKSTNEDTDVSYTISSIFISISKLFKKEHLETLLNTASNFLINILYKDIKHYETMDALIETFKMLSNSNLTTDENKRMYYVSRSNEIIRYKSACQKGEEMKLSPTSSEKLQKAFIYKEKGTEAFKKSDWKNAIFNYHCANNYVTGLMGLGNEEDTLAKNLGLVLINNIAICNMKLNKYSRAIDLLDQVIKSDPNNVKALFRRGKCLIIEKSYIHAEEDLEKALKLSPDDKEILNEMKLLKQKSLDYSKTEAKAYSKMFD